MSLSVHNRTCVCKMRNSDVFTQAKLIYQEGRLFQDYNKLCSLMVVI